MLNIFEIYFSFKEKHEFNESVLLSRVVKTLIWTATVEVGDVINEKTINTRVMFDSGFQRSYVSAG